MAPRAQAVAARPGPIPTRYRGVNFRSRLEARWAAFFDIVGWRWEYEPIDLDWYVSDFILVFPRGNVLVEIKPELAGSDLEQHVAKIEMSGWTGDYLLCGARLLTETSFAPNVSLGLHGQQWRNEDGGWDQSHAIVHRCLLCQQYSFHSADHYWYCAVNGCYDGNGYLDLIDRDPALELWRQAGNAVQWRAVSDDLRGQR